MTYVWQVYASQITQYYTCRFQTTQVNHVRLVLSNGVWTKTLLFVPVHQLELPIQTPRQERKATLKPDVSVSVPSYTPICNVSPIYEFIPSERDSPRDQLVVTLFLLTVFGLLLGAGIKNRMIKAGFDTSIPWNAGRRWWEVRPFATSSGLLALIM